MAFTGEKYQSGEQNDSEGIKLDISNDSLTCSREDSENIPRTYIVYEREVYMVAECATVQQSLAIPWFQLIV